MVCTSGENGYRNVCCVRVISGLFWVGGFFSILFEAVCGRWGLDVLLYLVFEVFLPGGFLGVVLVIVLGELDGSCTATAGSEPAGVRAPLYTAIFVCHPRLKSPILLLGTVMLCVGNYV